MTAIAYRDGVLAVDSLAQAGGTRCGRIEKLARSPAGDLAAAAGPSSVNHVFREWIAQDGYTNGVPFEPKCEIGQFEAIIVLHTGDVLRTDHTGRFHPLDAEFHALGSATDLLMGAMAAGASAVQAVEIAIRFDAYCGAPIESASLE